MHSIPEINFPSDLPIALSAEILAERVLRRRIGGRGGPSYLPAIEWPGGAGHASPEGIGTDALTLRFEPDALRIVFASDGGDRLRLVLSAVETAPRLRL